MMMGNKNQSILSSEGNQYIDMNSRLLSPDSSNEDLKRSMKQLIYGRLPEMIKNFSTNLSTERKFEEEDVGNEYIKKSKNKGKVPRLNL
jgi:hypothetical protein